MYRGHEFTIVQDIVREGFEGELETVREDAVTKWYCSDLTLITDVEQVYNRYGELKKGYCRLFHSLLGDRVVKETYTNVKKLLTSNTTFTVKDN
jgi:hypothetical protein